MSHDKDRGHGLDLSNEDVDDAVNFGIAFDDIAVNGGNGNFPFMKNRQTNQEGLSMDASDDRGSFGTRSPSPKLSESGSLTSAGSKRSRVDSDRDSAVIEKEGNSPKRRNNWEPSRTGLAVDPNENRLPGGNSDTAASQNTTGLSSIRHDREREGRCPDCGLETHLIVQNSSGCMKTPLNVEGEVLNGRCLFCHPLSENEGFEALREKEGSRNKNNEQPKLYNQMSIPTKESTVATSRGGMTLNETSPRFDSAAAESLFMTQQQQQLRDLAKLIGYSSRSRTHITSPQDLLNNPNKDSTMDEVKTAISKQNQTTRKHSWKKHIKMSANTGKNGATSAVGVSRINFNSKLTRGVSDLSSGMSQYSELGDGTSTGNSNGNVDDVQRRLSRNSHFNEEMGRLGSAVAAGMGMSCMEPTTRNSKSLLPQTLSPMPNDTQRMNAMVEMEGIPAHVRLVHNKLPSSIYHHHLFPMSKETEQAYIDKTLKYLESGGGDICDVIVAMRRFPFSLLIQRFACEKLYVQCFDRDHAHAIGLMGGIRTVIDAMEHHSEDVGLQRGCAGIIKHLATASRYNIDMLHRMGAVSIVVSAMERNPQCAPLLESCCWALGSMARASDPELKMSVAKGGGIHAAMNSVERFPNNESLLRAAFHCLQHLGYNPSSYNSNQLQNNQQQQLEQQQQQQQEQLQQHQQQQEQLQLQQQQQHEKQQLQQQQELQQRQQLLFAQQRQMLLSRAAGSDILEMGGMATNNDPNRGDIRTSEFGNINDSISMMNSLNHSVGGNNNLSFMGINNIRNSQAGNTSMSMMGNLNNFMSGSSSNNKNI